MLNLIHEITEHTYIYMGIPVGHSTDLYKD